MRLFVYVPDDAALKQAVETVLSRCKAPRIPAAELAAKLPSMTKKDAFIVLDPPASVDDLKKLDELAKGRRPRALFVIPKEQTAYKDAVKAAFNHFHRERRCRSVLVSREKAIAAAVKLESKAASIFRWGAILPMTIVALLMIGGLVLFRDVLLKKAAVTGLQAAFGAKADVIGLASGFAPSVNLENVDVANRRKPMANLFEFDKLAAGVELGPLLAGNVHVHEATLEGLRFGTTRTESGALPGAPEPEPEPPPPDPGPTFEDRLNELLKKLEPPALDDLETVRAAKRLEEEGRQKLEAYEELIKNSKLPAKLDEAKKALEDLQKLAPPASIRAVQEKMKSAGSLSPPSLAEARKNLEAANLINVDEEKKAVAKAKSDAETAKANVEKAKELIERAKKIEKVGILDIPKVKTLIDDVKKTHKALGESATALEADVKALEAAKQSIEKKKAESAEKLKNADAMLAEARKAVDAGGDLAAKYAEVAEAASKAKADIEAQQAELGGKLQKIQADVQWARDEADKFRRQVAADVEWAKEQPKLLEDALLADKAELLKRYNLEQFSADELVRSLFGEKAAEYLHLGLKAHQIAKPYLGRAKKEPKAVEKGPNGSTYTFPVPEAKVPGFWLKKASFSGVVPVGGRECVMRGTIQDLSSDQAAVGSEARIAFNVDVEGRAVSVIVVITPAGDVTVEITADGFTVKGRKFENKVAPAELSDGTLAAKLTARFGSEISVVARIDVTGMTLKPAGSVDSRLKFLETLYASVKGISADLELSYAEGRIRDFKCRSDKGKELSDELRKALTGQVEEAKKVALSRLDSMVAGPRAGAQAALDAFAAKAKPEALAELVNAQAKPIADAEGLLTARAAELTKVVTMSSDPKQAVEALKKELDALGAQTGEVGKRNEGAFAGQGPAIDEALKGVADQKGAFGTLQADLMAQVERITKLIK
jgi:uncharacterized protein (TIGR03545 family)